MERRGGRGHVKTMSKLGKIDFEILGYDIGRHEDWVYIEILYKVGESKYRRHLHGFRLNDIENHIETLLKNSEAMAKKILDTVFKEIRPWLKYPENLWLINKEIERGLKLLYDKWIEFKARELGLGVEEIKALIPPKTKIFVEREIDTIYTKRFIAYVKGKARAFTPKTPREAIDFSNRIRGEDIEARKVFGDLGPEAVIHEEPIPYLHVYKIKGGIGLSYTKLGHGMREARLLPIKLRDMDQLKEELGPLYNNLLSIIYKVYKVREEAREALAKVLPNIYWVETGLSRDMVHQLLREYYEYLKILNNIEAIPLLREFYKSMILPWFNALYSPHALIVSPTNTGKSMLYRLMVGEDPYTDITPITLVGGIDPSSRRPVLGVLHGRTKALQIERLEAKTQGETISLLIDYMKSGIAKRGVGVKTIEARGTAPIILTGNPVGIGRALKIQDWIRLGLLKNPEALGSRLLLFYTEERRELKLPRELDKIEVIREIGNSSYIIKKLRKIWLDPMVENWFREKDQIYIEEIEEKEAIGDLYHYINVLTREFSPRLKALALNNILVDYMDKLNGNIKEILEEACARYEWFKKQLINSIELVLSEYGRIQSPTTLALNLPKLLIKMILGIDKYLKDKMVLEERVEIPLKDIIDKMIELGLISKNPVYRARLRNYIRDNERDLAILGLAYSVDKDLVLVDTTQLSRIDIEKLARESQ